MQSRAAKTREQLLAAGRALFTEPGYHLTGTGTLVARAGVTRGALYHHFRGKQDLFEAVFRQLATELNEQTSAAARRAKGGLWHRVVTAFSTYLDVVAASPEIQRILLVDGAGVLGWQRWRELQYDYVASGVTVTLEKLMHEGQIEKCQAQPLAHLIQAALGDAALCIANAGGDGQTVKQTRDAFLFLLRGLQRHHK